MIFVNSGVESCQVSDLSSQIGGAIDIIEGYGMGEGFGKDPVLLYELLMKEQPCCSRIYHCCTICTLESAFQLNWYVEVGKITGLHRTNSTQNCRGINRRRQFRVQLGEPGSSRGRFPL